MSQPVQQLDVRKHHRLLAIGSAGMALRQPLDKLPIFGRKKLLLVRRPIRQLHSSTKVRIFSPGSWASQVKLDGQPMARG